MTHPNTTVDRPTLAFTALGLGVASALLITVVSFIALVLAAAALVTGGAAVARDRGRPAALTGMVLALGAVALFVVEVSG